eukprot:CAMPEP_0203671156 /NCGR_PEP_ID=MMETSP0090-20130426/7023_1 /ASSEMBLY_ACC=CAM_ASM_001088 /TAXON_ID=426623 /ORGANISM="Chaetoceros affinis, Strain CCMP159" /LENGTH=457 /DNA_ID=CAMNT_0050536167 /DNA_START=144 /DNA_END=1517 /DNA_ORIENTATION=+
MANNGGRQGGGGGGNQNMNEHVEFTVKAGEDLYLTGSENTILRVSAETNYSCLMLKTQRFSSLFRHYAKYHGLRKDDLEYYFVNALENEDTPESVQLQRGDTIMVRKRRRPEPPEAASDDDEYIKDMLELLDDEEHMDAVFLVRERKSTSSSPTSKAASSSSSTTTKLKSLSGNKREATTGNFKTPEKVGSNMLVGADDDNTPPVAKKSSMNEKGKKNSDAIGGDGSGITGISGIATIGTIGGIHNDDDESLDFTQPAIEIRAHKCILTARAEYFKAHFRKSASKETKISFRENVRGAIQVEPCFTEKTIRLMLEFIYTNRIRSISKESTNDLMLLLHLSDLWLLRDLKRLVEHELIRSHMDVNTVARMYCATEDYHADRLARACINYIMDNIREVTGNVAFQEEMKHYPHLCIPVLRAAAELIPEQSHKKQRTSDHVASSTPGVAALSSPVPDTDP